MAREVAGRGEDFASADRCEAGARSRVSGQAEKADLCSMSRVQVGFAVADHVSSAATSLSLKRPSYYLRRRFER